MNFNKNDTLNNLFVRVRHTHHQRAVKLFEEVGLNYGQPPIIFDLWEKDGLTQKELAQRRNLSPATITATLKRMEKAGWITRSTDNEDSRISRVYLTAKGKQIQGPLEEKRRQLEDETFEGFTDVEKILMRRLLLQIWDNLSKF